VRERSLGESNGGECKKVLKPMRALVSLVSLSSSLLSLSLTHTHIPPRQCQRQVELKKFSLSATMKDHGGEVTAVCTHPTSQYFVTASADKTWAFYDLEAALCLTQARAALHTPDRHGGGRPPNAPHRL
jgi:WD40 repeat protein